MTADKRDDSSFRQQKQPEHHNGRSPLLNIFPAINMIYIFALDFMHLCCLGVMKRLLEFCLTTIADTKLNRVQRLQLTQRLTNLSTQIPVEFQRTLLQSLGMISKWKATKFRFFLLYCGPLLLKDILPKELFDHFLYFHTVLRILCSDKLCIKFSSLAKDYLKRFVLYCGRLYKLESLALNFHALIHLSDDVSFFNCSLNHVTAFPFENLLGKIKKMIHSGRKPLQQLCNRLSEQFSIEKEKATIPPVFQILGIKKANCQKDDRITSFKYKNYTYSTSKPNNCILLKSGESVLLNYIAGSTENNLILKGQKVDILGDAYDFPTKSSD